MIGLISYYESIKGNYPEVINKDYYRIPMSHYQFQIYEILRAKERSSEPPGDRKIPDAGLSLMPRGFPGEVPSQVAKFLRLAGVAAVFNPLFDSSAKL